MGSIKLIEEFEEEEEFDESSLYIDGGTYQNFKTGDMGKFEFKILADIMKEDKEGREYVFKKVVYKMFEDVSNIGPVSQVVNANGTISKSRCSVYFSNLQSNYIVKHPYDVIKNLKQDNRIIIKGFRK